MNANKKFRAASNLDQQGRDPSIDRRRYYGGGVGAGGTGDLEYFDTIGQSTLWLLKAGGGGIVYLDRDDTVAAVIQPGQREYRAVTNPALREESFASAKAAREWLRHVVNSSGWIEQYDPTVEKYTPLEKVEAA